MAAMRHRRAAWPDGAVSSSGQPLPHTAPLPRSSPPHRGQGCVTVTEAPFVSHSAHSLTTSLWGSLLPPSRFRVHHPHQDGGGLPPAECRDRVRRLCPRPQGPHHLCKSPRGAGDELGSVSGWQGPASRPQGSPASSCHSASGVLWAWE